MVLPLTAFSLDSNSDIETTSLNIKTFIISSLLPTVEPIVYDQHFCI